MSQKSLQPQENVNGQQTQMSAQNSTAIGAVGASFRAFTYQIMGLYLRTPVKLFRPSRFDYMAYTRAFINHNNEVIAKAAQSSNKNTTLFNSSQSQPNIKYNFFKHSSIALLFQAVKKHGWQFIPNNVLPPIVANSFTGLVLYTSYLTTLNHYTYDYLHYNTTERNFEPRFTDCFKAGFIAGCFQSIFAAPIDTIYTRASISELLLKKHDNLWQYGIYKLRNVGIRGVTAGFYLSFIKESIGFAFYFSTFEFIKNQCLHYTIAVIDSLNKVQYNYFSYFNSKKSEDPPSSIYDRKRTFKIIKSTFILFGGACAATVLQLIQFPISKIQNVHLSRLESLDYYNISVPERRTPTYNPIYHSKFINDENLPKFLMRNRTFSNTIGNANKGFFLAKYWVKRLVVTNPYLSTYYRSYLQTFEMIKLMKEKKKLTWIQWLYKGFTRYLATTAPATGIGLLAFEIMRDRLTTGEEVFA